METTIQEAMLDARTVRTVLRVALAIQKQIGYAWEESRNEDAFRMGQIQVSIAFGAFRVPVFSPELGQ